jgi:hypothetical protein
LHPLRLEFNYPFENIGIDACGRFEIRTGEQLTLRVEKYYTIILTCLATRAVHFEVTKNLTSGKIICLICMFAAHQGVQKTIKSNNAHSFVSAAGIMDDTP